jgi:DNA-binding beta-propeller fold protein YncE
MNGLVVALLLAAAPPGAHDRVYTADQTSNTVSVFDPVAGKLLGVIPLGAPRTDVLSPIYRGQANVHGLGFSPDHRTLAVVSVATNSVTFIDTATGKPKGVAYIGRAPHEAFYTPDGKEVWVSVRGENYVSVLDPVSFKEVRRMQVADGPGMVRFRPDGEVAFVVSSFTPEVDVVDVKTHEIVKRIPVVSPFSPNLDVCSDGTMWMTHKDVGKVTVIDARTFEVKLVLDTGRITNHVACVDHGDELLAFVTVGGEDSVKVFTRSNPPKLIATIPTGALPHGLWPSDDGSRVAVGLENGDGIAILDTASRRELVRIAGGQAPQALVYVSDAAPGGADREQLKPLDEVRRPLTLTLTPPSGDRPGAAHGLAVVRALGLVDALDVNVLGLAAGTVYGVYVTQTATPPWKGVRHVAEFKTNPKGVGAAQAIGPLHDSMQPAAAAAPPRRWLAVIPRGDARAPPSLIAEITTATPGSAGAR